MGEQRKRTRAVHGDGTGGVAVDASGHVFVGDPGNMRIQKFEGTGTFLTAWSTALGFSGAIAVGGDYVFALDVSCSADSRSCTFAFEEFDGNGSPLGGFVLTVTTLFAGGNELSAFAVDGSGDVYVTADFLSSSPN